MQWLNKISLRDVKETDTLSIVLAYYNIVYSTAMELAFKLTASCLPRYSTMSVKPIEAAT